MAGAFGKDGKLIRRIKEDAPQNRDEGLFLLKDMTKRVAGNSLIYSIGAAAGGPLDYRTGVISPLHNPEWKDVPLKKIFEENFNVPFSVDVDTNAAALAEYRFGGFSDQRLLYVTVSTGMGGGFVVDGEIYRGVDGSHPEIGHHAVRHRLTQPRSVPCLCGSSDCLEALVCGTAIRTLYGKPAEELTTLEWDEVGYNLAQGLRNISAIYCPGRIVLGGGVALGGGTLLIQKIEQVLRDCLQITPVPLVSLSSLGYDTALWGAFALVSKDFLHEDLTPFAGVGKPT